MGISEDAPNGGLVIKDCLWEQKHHLDSCNIKPKSFMTFAPT